MPIWYPPGDGDGGGEGGVTDHGALTGLADDDHSQYHNDARGDARYWTLSTDLAEQEELDDAIDTIEATLPTLAPLASPTFTGNVVVPDADAATEAMNRQTSDARYPQAADVRHIVGPITQATYDGLTPDAETFYIIVG